MRKNLLTAIIFLVLAGVTLWTLFKDNSISQIVSTMQGMQGEWVLASLFAALFFVSAEGFMIWYLLRARKSFAKLKNCLMYSFVGFFFSGITPSATGGQPAQLYYMTKDKIKIGDSTVVLMTVAVLYKLVLVLLGIGFLVFNFSTLLEYLDGYMILYVLGLGLNVVVVTLLLYIMISPKSFRVVVLWVERVLVKVKILKESEKRKEGIHKFVEDYVHTVQFFLHNKRHIFFVFFVTFLQRISLFLITLFIYLGLGLSGENLYHIVLLQGAIYIAVDMLPLPGSQGISELMYQAIFVNIFTGQYLVASVLMARGFNFYFLLVVSAVVTGTVYLIYRKRTVAKQKIEKSK